MPSVPKPKVVKDPEYLAWMRQRLCWAWLREPGIHICGDTIGNGPSECSHLDGKSRDDRALPMCGKAHRTSSVSWHHGQRTFCRHYGLTKAELIQEAEAMYRAYTEGK